MLTKDQQTKLIQAAKAKNPNLTVDEAKDLISRANSLSPATQSAQNDYQNVISENKDKQFSVPNEKQGILEKVGRFLANTTINNVNTIKNFAGGNQEISQANQTMDDLFKQSQALTAQAKKETDPAKKSALLQQARDLMSQNATVASNVQGDINQKSQKSGITEKDIEEGLGKFLTKRGVGQSAELGALLLPGAKELQAVKGASIAQKAIASGVQGSIAGGMTGLANASQNAQTPEEAIKDVLTGSATGAAGGAILGGVAGRLSNNKVINKLSSEMDDIDRLVSTAENTQSKSKYAANAFRKIYQEAFPISKAGKSFERLRPEETIDDAIKYGWTGTGDQIKNRISQWTGEDGLATNIVKDAIKNTKNANSIDIPEVDVKKLAAKFSNVSDKEVGQQVLRLSDLIPGDLPGQTNIDDMITLERNLAKEGYQNFVTGKSTQNAKALESGQLKLELADKLGDTIDKFVQKNSESISKYTNDPRVLKLAKNIGGKNLVNDLKNAKTLSDLRSLQKSGVRMSQIIDLNSQLPSTIGNKFLGILNKVPIVGTIANQAINAIEQPVSTTTAVVGNSVYNLLSNSLNKVPEINPSNMAVIGAVKRILGNQ